MSDYLIKFGDTKLKYILSGGYEIQENQEIILAKKVMADGTEVIKEFDTDGNVTFTTTVTFHANGNQAMIKHI